MNSVNQRFCFVMPFHISERGGGAEVQAWLLAKELARRGFPVRYLAESMAGREGSVELKDGVEIRWLKHHRHFKWLNFTQYYRALRDANPAIIVQRMSSFETGVAGLFARRHRRVFAWICTRDDLPSRWWFTRQGLREGGRPPKGLLKRVVFSANGLVYDLSYHYGIRAASHCFTQNEVQRQMLLKNHGRESYRMLSGHEPPPSVVPADRRWQDRTVLWTANLSPRKRPEKFIQLASLLKDDGIRCLMVGGRDESGYTEALFRDVPANLEWLGRLPFEKAQERFRTSSVFVNTSSVEGFPNTFIQAWLHGVPVFSLEVDPDGEVRRNRLGHVESSLEAMAGAIRSLLSEEVRYRSESEHVRAYAMGHHTIARVADEFLRCLGENDGSRLAAHYEDASNARCSEAVKARKNG